MAQRFLSLEEAADQLGISKDRLLALRERNKVTGYKDGASWKFRSEAIEKLAFDIEGDVRTGGPLPLEREKREQEAAPRDSANGQEQVDMATGDTTARGILFRRHLWTNWGFNRQRTRFRRNRPWYPRER